MEVSQAKSLSQNFSYRNTLLILIIREIPWFCYQCCANYWLNILIFSKDLKFKLNFLHWLSLVLGCQRSTKERTFHLQHFLLICWLLGAEINTLTCITIHGLQYTTLITMRMKCIRCILDKAVRVWKYWCLKSAPRSVAAGRGSQLAYWEILKY